MYIRQQPSSQDSETYQQLKAGDVTADAHPNVFAWYHLVRKFTDAVRGTWGGAAGAAAKGGKTAAPAKKDEKKDEKKPEAKKEEKPADDDMDLFGSDEETEVCIFNKISKII